MKLGIRLPSTVPIHQIISHVDNVEKDTVPKNAQLPMDSSASARATPQDGIMLKFDTGAEVNILPIATYNKLSLKPPLKPTDVKFTAYRGTSLSPLGTCQLKCNVKDLDHTLQFFVLNVDSQLILGLIGL